MTAPESDQNSWLIKQNYFDRYPKELSLTPQSITFGTQKLILPDTENIPDEQPLAYRFGIKWISGYRFTIGRKYQIFVNNNYGEIIKISFGSYYGMHKTVLHNQYIQILNQLWEIHFDDLVSRYLELFRKKIPFILANVKFDEFGLKIKSSSFVKDEEKFLAWPNVGTKNYRTYFAIFSIENSATINKTYSYLNDWNTGVLYSVVQTILKGMQSK